MKKKFTKTLVSLFLAAIMTFSFTACKGTEPEDKEDAGSINTNTVNFVGKHDINVTETDKDFITNGKCDYQVIIPENPAQDVVDAKNDFLILFKKATGIDLPFKYENAISTFATSDKYIFIGDTKFTAQAGIAAEEFSEENIKSEGIRIVTKDNSIFLLGGGSLGINNAAYKFLEIYFNFDFYYRNCIDLDQNVTECKFKDLDITDVPDINHIYGAEYVYLWDKSVHNLDREGLGDTYAEEIKYKAHRAGHHLSSNQMLMPVHRSTDLKSATMHNATYYIPRNTENEKFFSTAGDQLCYSAKGNPEDLEKMLDLCMERVIYSVTTYTPDKYPHLNYIQISMADNQDLCGCPACKADYDTIGYTAHLIKFMNKFADRIKAWMDSQKDENAEFHYAYRENFKLSFMAYGAYTEPPVDENGQPISEDVILRDNISVWHVSSRGVEPNTDIYDERFPGGEKQIAGWDALTKDNTLWFWHNSGNVQNNIYFSDGFTTYSNNFFEAMAAGGYEFIYAAHFLQGGGDATAWQNLLLYIINKLRWDCARNSDEYIMKYMKAMFKDGAETMYDLLMEERIHFQSIVCNDKRGGNDWGRNILTNENYPYSTIKGWIDKCDVALKEVEHLKNTDPTLHKVVSQRINIEKAAHLYKAISQYGNSDVRPFTQEQLLKYKSNLYEIGIITPSLKYSGKPLYEYGK